MDLEFTGKMNTDGSYTLLFNKKAFFDFNYLAISAGILIIYK